MRIRDLSNQIILELVFACGSRVFVDEAVPLSNAFLYKFLHNLFSRSRPSLDAFFNKQRRVHPKTNSKSGNYGYHNERK
jgi:hypothetical protein